MRIMTFNLRFENDRDEENSWLNRRDMVVGVIRKYTPCILGTQEGTRGQLNFLQDHLPGYRMHAPERHWDDTCQYPTLFYREDKLRVQEGGEFWLSLTPAVHRSKDWDSAFPRMINYALFHHTERGKLFWTAVTHLDHLGGKAREEQSKMIAGWLEQRREPCILMGDFNDLPGSSVHRLVTCPETELEDTWELLGRGENAKSMTHHDFSGVPGKFRMDWILVSSEFHVVNACIVRDHSEGRYPSDHFPYAADLEWK